MGGGGFGVEDCADEGWVLVREAVFLLLCPGASFEVVHQAERAPPGDFLRLEWDLADVTSTRGERRRGCYHLAGFGVLYHRYVYDT